MKVDRRNPHHWLYLLGFGFSVACALFLRPWLHRRRSGLVLLYGHKLCGNLLAIYSHALRNPRPGFRLAFLTMDPSYHRELRDQGVCSVLASSPAGIRCLATADGVVSDHGLHAMQAMLGRADLKFFDVWHGIPFKGFDADDFRVQQRYDEAWVASPMLAAMYVEKFGFEPRRVFATGYPRTDRLVDRDESQQDARMRLGLPGAGKIVLFAPTWLQDDKGRSLFPFGCDESSFLDRLSAWAVANDATVVLRTHLNSGTTMPTARAGIASLPGSGFPDSERALLASDVLVCDWSSIAFDFLLLDRPAVFLDVPAPFRKGFSLGPEYRYGRIATDLPQLMEALTIAVREPATYWSGQRARHDAVRAQVYGDCADGGATRRCIARLAEALAWVA